MTNNSRPSFRRVTAAHRCTDCNRVLTSAIRSEPGRPECDDCYDLAGLEAEHQDGGHEDEANADCLMCNPDARADRSKPSTTRTTGTRIDHRPCYAKGAHDKSREGREMCRNAGGPKA